MFRYGLTENFLSKGQKTTGGDLAISLRRHQFCIKLSRTLLQHIINNDEKRHAKIKSKYRNLYNKSNQAELHVTFLHVYEKISLKFKSDYRYTNRYFNIFSYF